jgi:predicted ATPase/DNA-binding CsgD family transcriptional regulator
VTDERPIRITAPVSLPLQRTPIIGREHEVLELLELITRPTTRLVTLTGLGGIGKTRLAVELATRLSADGRVAFVELAPVTAPDFVLPAIAGAMGLALAEGADAAEELVRTIANQPTVLVLDNAEHVVSAGRSLTELLSACSTLTIVVTSRVALDVPGEHRWRVRPLAVPADPAAMSARDEGSVQLFAAVAATVDARFRLEHHNLADVAAICRRLEGHPLSIELAAARSATLGPAALRGELDRRPAVELLAGLRSGERHDLATTLSWTYEHLPATAQTLVRRVAVFRGWFELVAVERVARTALDDLGAADTLDALSLLVDHHLVEPLHTTTGTRYRVPAPIRDAALAWLAASPEEVSQTVDAHLGHHRRLAAAALAQAEERAGRAWVDRLAMVEDDLVAALHHSLDHDRAAEAMEIGAALAWLWTQRGTFRQERDLLDSIGDLPSATTVAPVVRAVFVSWSATLAAQAGAGVADVRAITEQIRRDVPHLCVAAQRNAVVGAQWRLTLLALMTGDHHAAADLATSVLADLDDRRWRARFESLLAIAVGQEGDLGAVLRLAERAMVDARALGDRKTALRAALVLFGTAVRLSAAGRGAEVDLSVELPTLDDLLWEAEALGDPEVLDWVRPARAALAMTEGDLPAVARECAQLLRTAPRAGWTHGITLASMALAMISAVHTPDLTARIHGMCSQRWEIGRNLGDPDSRVVLDTAIAHARQTLGGDEFRETANAAAVLAWTDAVDELILIADRLAGGTPAIVPDARTPGQAVAAQTGSAGATRRGSGLTTRETAVLRLLADGRTNKEISQELSMSAKTAMHHTTAIYRKLGVRGRTEAAALALRQGLVTGEQN